MSRARDLALGVELARTGGRPALARTLLTTLGVAIGVVLLLVAAAVPSVIDRRDARAARIEYVSAGGNAQSGRALAVTPAGFGTRSSGFVELTDVRAEGPGAPVPPGLKRLPAPGEAIVSPALAALARRDPATRLELRARIVGRIGERGLFEPGELRGYRNPEVFEDEAAAERVLAFGRPAVRRELDAFTVVLAIVGIVGLLAPIGAFVAGAVRFGSDGRDRRLAAVRLAGADRVQTRWIAAGEALAGALGGLTLGAVGFVALRPLAEHVEVSGIRVFPGDVVPRADLTALVLLGVPAAAIGLTLVALRAVVAEPLGVSRRVRPVRRRLWWRLAFPLVGVALLRPYWHGDDTADLSEWQIAAGVLSTFLAAAAVLPWALERVVARVEAGPVAWELARRRLLADPGAAARAVGGVVVAVAAAIALQCLLATVDDDEDPPATPAVQVTLPGGDPTEAFARARDLALVAGVRAARPVVQGTVRAAAGSPSRALFVVPCPAIRRGCRDGDSFVRGDLPELHGRTAALTGDQGGPSVALRWAARPRPLPSFALVGDGESGPALVLTPGALRTTELPGSFSRVDLTLRRAGRAATVGRVRALMRRTAPAAVVADDAGEPTDRQAQVHDLRRALTFGGVLALVAMGAGLLVSTLEALRERRRALAVLAAVGARPGTLRLSVLWQTALPVLVGLVCAVLSGLGLAAMVLGRHDLQVDWTGIGLLAGVAALVVLGVTALTLPLATRLSGPEHLRTE